MTAVTVDTERSDWLAVARATQPSTRVPVVGTLTADPFTAYRRARGDAPSFFFETGGGQSGWGYFGVEPDEFRTVDGPGALDQLREIHATGTLVRGDCEIPFPGGWFGWLSYDIAREIESLPDRTVDDRGLPRLELGCYPTVATWEEPHDGATELRLVAAIRSGEDPAAAYERGVDRIEALATAVAQGKPTSEAPPVSSETATFQSRCGRDAYRERVKRVQTAIRDGETFQANISHRLEAPAVVSPIEVFRALRRVNPAPYGGVIEFPAVDLISASPELLLSVVGQDIETEPIAGTRPRGTTPARDDELERDLRTDEKERAEHAMLVDLERNDLGKVAEFGSVSVDEYRRVDRYAEVMHLVSRISGAARPETDLADAVRAVFPGGTITGAPKPRTMELIESLEGTRRGPYTGSMAAIGFDGRATLNIVIRTLVRCNDTYGLRVGAGIVHDSDPDREYDETMAKGRALITAVDRALEARLEVADE